MQQLICVSLTVGLTACAGAPRHPAVDGQRGACAILDAVKPGLVILDHGAQPRSRIPLTAPSERSRRARAVWRHNNVEAEFVTIANQNGLQLVATTATAKGDEDERHDYRMTGGSIHLVSVHQMLKRAPLALAVGELFGLHRSALGTGVRVQHLLPEEAVGPGAEWVSTSKDDEQSGTVTEFELVSYANDVATLRLRRYTCGRRIWDPPDGGHEECFEGKPPPDVDCFFGVELSETVSTGSLTIDTAGVPFPTGTVTTRGKGIYNNFGTKDTFDIDETVSLEWL